MAAPRACLEIQAALDTARGVRAGSRFLSSEKREARKDVRDLAKQYRHCLKENASKRGVMYVRALAQVAHDVGIPFPLKPNFERSAPLRKADDTARRALKLDSNKDILAAGQAFSKKQNLGPLMEPALVLEALEDTRRRAKGGFVAAQIATAVGDALAIALSAGAYAAAAPAVHGAVAAGQKLTLQKIDQDIARNKERYTRALSARKLKIDTKSKEQEANEQEAAQAAQLQAAQERLQAAQAAAELVPPWYAQPLTLFGGVTLLAVGVYWYKTRKP